jgi:hypothetical protein
MGLFGRHDVIEDPRTRTFGHDDHRVDFIEVIDPETGLFVRKPVAATPEELRQREVDGWRKALESVDYRLAALDPNDVLPPDEPRSEEWMAKRRAGLENERERCLDELARLEVEPQLETPKKRRR